MPAVSSRFQRAKADITDKVNPATIEKLHIADRFPLSWTLKESKIQQKNLGPNLLTKTIAQ